MAYNEEVTMMMSVVPGAMTGISTMMGGLVSINNVFMDMTRQIDASFGLVDASLIAAGTIVAQFGFKAAEAFGEFEQGMKIAQMVSGQTKQEIQQLSQVANQFSVQYRTDIDQITEGLQTLGRAGLNSASEQTEVLAEGLNTAKLESRDLNGVLEELIQNTALLGGDLNSSDFGEASKYLNDVMVATSMTAPITTHDVSETLKYSGGIAAAAGAKLDTDEGKRILEDYMGAIAAFAQKGVTGSIAGTALRAFFNKPATQDSSVTDALASIKLKPEYLWEDDEETMKPVSEQIAIIKGQMDKLNVSTMDQLQIWSKIVGGKMGQQMMKLEADDIKNLTREIRNADDAGNLAEGTFQTFQSNMKEMSEQGQVAFRSFGEKVATVLNPLIDLATKFMEVLSNPAVSQGIFIGFLGFLNNVVGKIKNVFGSLKSEVSQIMDYISKGDTLYAMRPSTERKNSRFNTSSYTSPYKKSSNLFSYDSNYGTSDPLLKYQRNSSQKRLERFLTNNQLSISDAALLKNTFSKDFDYSRGYNSDLANELRLYLSSSSLSDMGIESNNFSFLGKGKYEIGNDVVKNSIRYLMSTGQWDSKYTKRIEQRGLTSDIIDSIFNDVLSTPDTLPGDIVSIKSRIETVQRTKANSQKNFFKRSLGLTQDNPNYHKLSSSEVHEMNNLLDKAIDTVYSRYGLSLGDDITNHPKIIEDIFGTLTMDGQPYMDYFGKALEQRGIYSHRSVVADKYVSKTTSEGGNKKVVSKVRRKDISDDKLLDDISKDFGIKFDTGEYNPFTEGLSYYNARRDALLERVLAPYLNEIGPHKMYFAEYGELFAPISDVRKKDKYPDLYSIQQRYGITEAEFVRYQRRMKEEGGIFYEMSNKEIAEQARRITNKDKDLKKVADSTKSPILKDIFGNPMMDYSEIYEIPEDFKKKFYTNFQKGTLTDEDELRFLALLQLGEQTTTFGKHMGEDISVKTPSEWFMSDVEPSIEDFKKMHLVGGGRLSKLIKNPKQQAEFFEVFMENFKERKEVIQNLIESEKTYQKVLNDKNAFIIESSGYEKKFTENKINKAINKTEARDIARIFGINYTSKTKKGTLVDDILSDIVGSIYEEGSPQAVLGSINTGYLKQVKSFNEMKLISSFFGIEDYTETQGLSKKDSAEKMKNDLLNLIEKRDSVYIGKKSIKDIVIPEEYLLETTKKRTEEIRSQNVLLEEQASIIQNIATQENVVNKDSTILEESQKNPPIAENSGAYLGKSLEVSQDTKDRWKKEHEEREARYRRIDYNKNFKPNLDDPWGYKRYYGNETNTFGEDYFKQMVEATKEVEKDVEEIKQRQNHYYNETHNAAMKSNAKDKIPIRTSNPYEGYDEYYGKNRFLDADGNEFSISDDGDEYPWEILGYKDGNSHSGEDDYQDFKKRYLTEQKEKEEEIYRIMNSDNRSRLSYLNPFYGKNIVGGVSNRIEGFWKGLQKSESTSLLRTRGTAESLTKLQRAGNVASNAISMLGGPWMVALQLGTMAVQKFQEAQQEYTEKIKNLLTNLDEAMEKQSEAETIFFEGRHEDGLSEIKGWLEDHEDATSEEKEEALLSAYEKIYDNTDKGIGELDKNTQQLAIATEQVKQASDRIGEVYFDNSFFAGDGAYNNIIDSFDNIGKGIDKFFSTGNYLFNEFSTAIMGQTSKDGSKYYNDKFGIEGTSVIGNYLRDNEPLLESWQKREDYPWSTDFANLFAANVWKKGNTQVALETVMGDGGFAMLNDQISSTGGWGTSAWTRHGYNINKNFNTLQDQNRLQMGLKNYGSDFSKLAAQTRRFEKATGTTALKSFNKYFKRERGDLRKTLKNLSVHDPKLVSYIKSLSIKTGMSAQQVLMAAQLQQLKEMQGIAKDQVTPRMQSLVSSAFERLNYGKATLSQVQGSGDGAVSAAQNAAAIAVLLNAQLEDELNKKSHESYMGNMKDPTKAKYQNAEQFASAVDYAMEHPDDSDQNNVWLRYYGEQKAKAHAAVNYQLQNPNLSDEDAKKRAEYWWNHSSHDGSALYDTLRKGSQKALANNILSAYDASLNDDSGEGSGSGSGSGDKDKDSGTRKERVDLVLCNRKTIPKLNVNLFKKPPSFTILNKNFKLRDVKINSEDKPKAIMAAIKNGFIDVQKRTDPKIIQDEDAVYDPVAASDGTNVPSGSAKTRTT